jgi:hypothetical protein
MPSSSIRARIHGRGHLRYTKEMRSRKYRVVSTLEWASNRLIRAALRAGLVPRAFAT